MTTPNRTCKKCGQSKPATTDHFYTTTISKKDGRRYVCMRSECKQCTVAYTMTRNKVCRDPNYKIRRALAGGGGGSWVEKNLGYTLGEIRAHLEKQFVGGMTWELFFRGDIHIDHIVPLKEFVAAGKAIDAWKISNLRPAWARDNLGKADHRHFLL